MNLDDKKNWLDEYGRYYIHDIDPDDKSYSFYARWLSQNFFEVNDIGRTEEEAIDNLYDKVKSQLYQRCINWNQMFQ